MRSSSIFAVLLTLVVSSCTPSGETTPTLPAVTVDEAGSLSGTSGDADAVADALLGGDDAVRIGVLENGLTYYIRENDSPGSRAQLRLVVNAGSAQEGPDQAGAAHYLEHMLFNGTEAFPKNELISTLEGFGAQFGPDVNAYTSYDETVYELEVATDRRGVVETALDVLFEWATAATLDPVDIDEERGVVIEEWRLRDQGISGRISEAYQTLLLDGTSYEGHAPIGTIESLEMLGSQELRQFYEEWYQPQHMAVVAVGDFDAGDIEQEIIDRFESVSGPTDSERTVTVEELRTAPRATVLIDPEYPSAFVSIFFETPADHGPATVSGLRDSLATDLALSIVQERMDNDILRGNAPFFEVDLGDFSFVRGVSVIGIDLTAQPEDLEASLGAGIDEVRRVLTHGVTESEFDRARSRAVTSLDQELAGEQTTQDTTYADLYVSHFLEGVPITDLPTFVDTSRSLLAQMEPEDVRAALARAVEGVHPAVLAVGPRAAEDVVPDQIALIEAIAAAELRTVEAREAESDLGDDLMVAPDNAEVVATGSVPAGVTEIRFGNGVTVLLKETAIAENELVMEARSPGGYSLWSDTEVPAAALMSDVVLQSGVAGFDQVQLDRLLSDSAVSLSMWVDETEDGMFGRAATEDVATLFQLMHLYMTQPNAEPAAADVVLNQIRPFAENPNEIPSLARSVALWNARYGDNVRYRPIPTAAELEAFDIEEGLEAFRRSFADADDWVFAFSGDFDTDEMVELSSQYLGTLPAVGDGPDVWLNLQPPAPEGVVQRLVEVGEDPQGSVVLFITGDQLSDPTRRIEARLLELVVESRLRNRLREALAATYSPFVSISHFDRPDGLLETYIEVSGDPLRLDEISSETLSVLGDVRSAGPTNDELSTAQQQLIQDYELVSNEFWVDRMLFYTGRDSEDLSQVFERIRLVRNVDVADLIRIAQVAWPEGQFIEVQLRPES